jgi:hypothetical protein
MRRRIHCLISLALLTIAAPALAAPAEGKQTRRADALAWIWEDPTDIQSRDLLEGQGGEKHEPKGPFTFEKEDMNGTNPKYDVRDADGKKWKVKLGEEVQSETTASRFVWAVGFFADEDYFLPTVKIEGLPHSLKRGQKDFDPDGAVHNVRMKLNIKREKQGEWKWKDNVFNGTKELNGLRVLMALMNNWDLKDENNVVFEVRPKDGDPKRIFEVSDLGATFGTTGRAATRAGGKSNLKAFEDSKFIIKSEDGKVNFGTPSRAAAVHVLETPEYIRRLKLESIGDNIPVSDAKWMGSILAKLSPKQIRDAFKAGGYDPDEVEAFARVIEGRIAELSAL